MTYRISKEHAFSASHQLSGLPDEHPCARLHGHNYTLRITLTADDVDEVGFVFDYGALKPFTRWVDAAMDHRHLNETTTLNPTAENLSRFLNTAARALLDLPDSVTVSVAVSETPKTWAEWLP